MVKRHNNTKGAQTMFHPTFADEATLTEMLDSRGSRGWQDFAEWVADEYGIEDAEGFAQWCDSQGIQQPEDEDAATYREARGEWPVDAYDAAIEDALCQA